MPERKFLTFHLCGAMQSWGEIAVGDSRGTSAYPSKSAVLGLLAGALGITRAQEDQHQKLAKQLKMAVRVFSNGKQISDFHTIQMPPEKAVSASRQQEAQAMQAQKRAGKTVTTKLSERNYLCDAYFGICLWEVGQELLLEQLKEALLTPLFTPYLGRKSCPPTLPFYPKLQEASDLKSVLRTFKPHEFWQDASSKETDWPEAIRWEADGSVTESLEASLTVERYDRVISRMRWQFAARTEWYGTLAYEQPKEEVVCTSVV